MAGEPYGLEQAETDVANLRALADRQSEVITKNDSTDPPNTPAAGLIHHSIAGSHKYASADGNGYTTGHLMLRYAGGGQVINSTSAVTPAGMSCPVAAGKTYFMSGAVTGTQGATASQQALRLSATGGATSVNVLYLASTYGFVGGAGMFSQYGNVTAVNTDLATASGAGGITAGLGFGWMISGLITFNAAGTFAVQARCVTLSTDTWTFLTDSHLVLYPIA